MAPFGGRTQKNRRLGRNNQKRKWWLSRPLLLLVLLIGIVVAYMMLVISVAMKTPELIGAKREDAAEDNQPKENQGLAKPKQPAVVRMEREKDDRPKGPRGKKVKVELPKITGLQPRKVHRPRWMGKPHGAGVKPQVIVPPDSNNAASEKEPEPEEEKHPDPQHILTAYAEQLNFEEWEQKPLPVREHAKADKLEEMQFPKLNSCKKLPEMIPADEYPEQDTFLPWIHDVFPTHDGKFIQFIAQNRRRCRTGNTIDEIEALHLTQPNIALFQHIPVLRIKADNGETRYRLCSHEEADPDGVATRFICRFKPGMEETLSVYNFDYDYAAFRKNGRFTFKYDDGGIKSVHLSQFIFRCPVPEHLVDIVKSGESVKNDWATLFVDVIPIRTPPRYGRTNEFLQPHYSEAIAPKAEQFDAHKEWGDNHILPRIEDSGRWENFPICRPSLLEYYPEDDKGKAVAVVDSANTKDETPPKHRLVACMWASAGYTTRGNRFAVNDGQRRMLEWIHINKLLGFEHFYLYDNSYAFSDEITLKPIADLFPGEITYIKWPFNVCNNNPNNVDSPGERSSQYAAESSCRLRFGPHVDWIGQFDMDEYLIPMGEYTSLIPILDKLDKTGTKTLSFGSWRSWPRRDLIEKPVPIKDHEACGTASECFELQVPFDHTYLQTYNCDRQSGPKKDVMPAEKQLYRTDYVLQHFIHYSSVTALSALNKTEFEKAGYSWHQRVFPDPNSRFTDEINEATMLHTKAIARQDTAGWLHACKKGAGKYETCRVGVPYPENWKEGDSEVDDKDWLYNCYVNNKVENYWVPHLEEAIRKEHGHIFEQQ